MNLPADEAAPASRHMAVSSAPTDVLHLPTDEGVTVENVEVGVRDGRHIETCSWEPVRDEGVDETVRSARTRPWASTRSVGAEEASAAYRARAMLTKP